MSEGTLTKMAIGTVIMVAFLVLTSGVLITLAPKYDISTAEVKTYSQEKELVLNNSINVKDFYEASNINQDSYGDGQFEGSIATGGEQINYFNVYQIVLNDLNTIFPFNAALIVFITVGFGILLIAAFVQLTIGRKP